ncbi:MAG: lytic transglycosylase domain-containing protein [Gammaproteobacteria bacterium]|nr:lytic transglycosylase domain-containing protein [Gammaproteobacteria bacterium]
MRRWFLKSLVIAGCAVCAAGARADIYKFVDQNNVVHFTNMPNDPRYKLFWRERKPSPAKAAVNKGPVALGARTSANRVRYTPMIESAAQAYQVDPALLHAVILTESGYNPDAVSPKGATGLMQLMPDTARRYGVTNIYDPSANIHGGTRYLRDLLRMFNNNIHLAVAAYNAGENAVIGNGNKIPPYPETKNYVAKVTALYQRLKTKKTTL